MHSINYRDVSNGSTSAKIRFEETYHKPVEINDSAFQLSKPSPG